MIDVRSVVALGIRAAGTDVARVGIAEVFDKPALELQFRRFEHVLLRELRLLQQAHVVCVLLGLLERLARVRERRPGALADLLEVRLDVVLSTRIEVERDRARREARRIQSGIHLVHLLLKLGNDAGERGELRHRASVDALQPLVAETDAHAAFPSRDPFSAFDVPVDVALGRIGDHALAIGLRDWTQVEGKPVGKRAHVVALCAKVAVRAIHAVPEAHLADFARVVGAEDNGIRGDGAAQTDRLLGDIRASRVEYGYRSRASAAPESDKRR